MYQDERKLFTLIGIIIAAATLLLLQVNAARTGKLGPLVWAGSTVVAFVEELTSAVVGGVRDAGGTVLSVPQLGRENATLRDENGRLEAENARLVEALAASASQAAIAPVAAEYPNGVEARIIGFPPENESRTVTIDRGSRAGIKPDEGVVAASGVVGRIAEVGPFSSTVLLITDYTSRIPAIVERGRWWGIAQGNLTSVRMQYVSQDARLRIGDVVVTGNGRSFSSGIPIGTVVEIDRSDAALYQTAVLRPAVALGALDRVVVVAK
ncbi:MAG TPA: rod shape-determining protein MreC [Candidatus Dormibacteraeota bacterium]|nr:rod shape-determining protein MreC [Candidatus Dormibacteraeota bacterium]